MYSNVFLKGLRCDHPTENLNFLCGSPEAWDCGIVQRAGGEAASDRADGRPHVPAVREDDCRDLQDHGIEENSQPPVARGFSLPWCC
ncbi:UNVERIFIED_CONTAM: hypothetical protein FKN15_007810 [Acipenser sinensis]